MITIYEQFESETENKLGYIDQKGDVYGYLEETGEEEFIGRIDYEEGVVYMLDEEEDAEIALGWIDDDNNIIASFEEIDIILGSVKQNGDLYFNIDEETSQQVGRVDGMTDSVEGAAALLIFFDFGFEDEDDDE